MINLLFFEMSILSPIFGNQFGNRKHIIFNKKSDYLIIKRIHTCIQFRLHYVIKCMVN